MDNGEEKMIDYTSKGETAENDNQNVENIEEGKEKMREGDIAKAQADEEKGKDYAEEGKDSAKEADISEEKGEGSEKIGQDPAPIYSTVYQAPYGGVYGETSADAKNASRASKSERKGANRGVVIAVVAICLAITMILGTFAGLTVGYMLYAPENYETGEKAQSDSSEGEEVITIIKNNSGVKVNEETYSEAQEELSLIDVVEKAADSVVEVSTLTSSNYGQYVSSGAGSGVIVSVGDTYSYIVTNYHVVGDSDSITVRLTDEREYEAIYVDGDESLDLAMIKIEETEKITPAAIGSSSALKVGQGVVAIGNPLGELGGTVTDGIISALDREITIDGSTMVLLQTNAAVNPGNSGGGLFNMAGELVGIVNAKESATGIEGLAFAIPIDLVYDEILDILNDGYIHGRLTFGFTVAYFNASLAYRYFGVPYEGIYVVNSSDEQFVAGDRITQINSTAVTVEEDVTRALAEIDIGDEVTFRIVRGQKTLEISIVAREYVPSGATK